MKRRNLKILYIPVFFFDNFRFYSSGFLATSNQPVFFWCIPLFCLEIYILFKWFFGNFRHTSGFLGNFPDLVPVPQHKMCHY